MEHEEDKDYIYCICYVVIKTTNTTSETISVEVTKETAEKVLEKYQKENTDSKVKYSIQKIRLAKTFKGKDEEDTEDDETSESNID